MLGIPIERGRMYLTDSVGGPTARIIGVATGDFHLALVDDDGRCRMTGATLQMCEPGLHRTILLSIQTDAQTERQ